jgi:hypothetical protein
LQEVSGRLLVPKEKAIAEFSVKRKMIMLMAQQMTELGDLKRTNAACVLGKGECLSMAATLAARI